jgi:hypothetical protein
VNSKGQIILLDGLFKESVKVTKKERRENGIKGVGKKHQQQQQQQKNKTKRDVHSV